MGSQQQQKQQLVLFGHEFPNDDLYRLFANLQRLSRERKLPLLTHFLSECTSVLKQEIALLPQYQKDHVPPFKNVLGVVAALPQLKSGPLAACWEGALLCILELGTLIGHYEAQDLDYNSTNRRTTLVGMSIGLLAAAVTASARSLHELAFTAAESVRVSWRFCLLVDRVSSSLESDLGANDESKSRPSWAYAVTSLTEDEIKAELDTYNAKHSSSLAKLAISHVDSNSIGVTGPPSKLQDLFRQSQVLRYSKHAPLPIHGGLCHVPGIYDLAEVDSILSNLKGVSWATQPASIPLLSPNTGLPFPAENAFHLFELICNEALTTPLYFDKLTEGVINHLSAVDAPECTILHFRTTIASNDLMSKIESRLTSSVTSRLDIIDWSFKEYNNLPSGSAPSKLAVVGMSCRLPGGADDTELFWKLITEGRDVHTTIPADRFDVETHYDPTGKTENASETPFGNFINEPGLFDAGFFNMSPREAEQTDPMQRLALVTAYEALEMAGFAPNRTPSTTLKRIATFYASGSDDYREVNAGQNISTYGVPGGERAFGNGRINYFFKFGGPSFSIDTACSGGLAAVNAACSSIWSGEADTALAGGLNVISNSDIYCMLSKGHFLSKTGQCKVWDKGADGYCRADGIGSVVIKRLEDAEADNDNILATIVAGFTNHSAEAISITHPHAGAQKNNYSQVLSTAGVNPGDVSYVELHGTGTQAGDAVESESVADVFAPSSLVRGSNQRLHLGAVKSNIGHGEAAAGITSFIKMLLIYQNNLIPRHVGIKTEINPVVAKNLFERNMGLCFENTPWPKVEGRTRYAIVNSFGAHGGNTTMLLEDAPINSRIGTDPRSSYVISVSAKSKPSLKGNIGKMLEYLDENPDVKLGDLSYTTNARRIHHSLRLSTAVTDVAQLQNFLKSALGQVDGLRNVVPPTVGFAFTGQGAFYSGVGVQLFNDFPYFHRLVLQLDRTVERLGFPSVLPAIKGESVDDASPLITQLTIVVLQIALVKFWELLGVAPNIVVGHSLGEYAAMVAAGVLSETDALFLVGKRAELLLTSCEPGTHVMLSVRESPDGIKKLVKDTLFEISCMNGQKDTVISGERKNIEKIKESLTGAGLKCMQLEMPYAFHSAQLDPVLGVFEQIAANVTFKAPKVPYISPLLGKCIFDGKTINASYLRRAAREPVDFYGALSAAYDVGLASEKTMWLENGPHPICASFIRNYNPNSKVHATLRKKEDNHVTITSTLASLYQHGVAIRWNEYYKPYEKAHKLLYLSHYQWNNKNYWLQYHGTWALDKSQATSIPDNSKALMPVGTPLKSSSVHQIVHEDVTETTCEITAVTNIMRGDILDAAKGHAIHGVSVVTASIWTDMTLTVGEYLFKKLLPKTEHVYMNIVDMEVQRPQIAQKNTNEPQLLQIEADIDLDQQYATVQWYNLSKDGVRSTKPFASATILYEDARNWQTEWRKVTHLLTDRISALSQMARDGRANRLSRGMVYTLFGNVVDYDRRYQGMQSVVLNELEAYAEISLDADKHGSWHTPPHWIDSIFQMAGFIMNGSDSSNTKDYFYVTPGWDNLRWFKPFQSGVAYQSYCRMFPSADEENTWTGDIYVLENSEIIGVLGQIKFKRVPRALMSKIFVAPEIATESASAPAPSAIAKKPQSAPKSESRPAKASTKTSTRAPAAKRPLISRSQAVADSDSESTTSSVFDAPRRSGATTPPTPPNEEKALEESPSPAPAAAAAEPTSKRPALIQDCINLIAREAGLAASEFTDEASFTELGIDSLMALVVSEKLRSELGVEVRSSIFLECSCVEELVDFLK